MGKNLAVAGASVLAMVLSAVLWATPVSGYQAHAENREPGDAVISECGSTTIIIASLAAVAGLAVVAKRHLVSKIR